MKAFHLFLQACAWLAALLFVAAGCMLTYEVMARYLFVAPTIWAAELSQLCLIWGSMIAMPWLLKTGRHISVDAVTERLGPGGKRFCHILAMAVLVIFSGWVTWKGWGIFWDSFTRGRTTGSMLDLPIWIAEFAIPFGFGLLTLQALVELGSRPKGPASEEAVME
jgi:C4-dicarboxylate transporter DctQ subunit